MLNDIKYRLRFHNSSNICKDCMKFCRKYENNNSNVESISHDWHKIFNKVCRHLGINKSSATVLWLNMCYGNWEHLHKTDIEKNNTTDDWFNKFYYDLFYCSDRWTVDRLMRVHWCYLQWIKSIDK